MLLILAGVSINLVLGNNGIISKTKESRTETRMSQIDEQVKLAIGDAYADGIGSITDSGLKSALNNRLGEGTYDISGDETTGWKVTVKETGKTYDIASNVKINSPEETGSTVDWNKILEEANKNPESFKHEDQSKTNNDIGIGTDGKPVNMDLWNASIINENEITLGTFTGCGGNRGYVGEIKDGKIQGKIPAYIKKAGYEEFYKVTSLDCTFHACENLEIAPEIPSDVTNMARTFGYCTNLKTVPKIPSGVTNMNYTFQLCGNLTGTVVINATTLNHMDDTFAETVKPIVLKGTSTYLEKLAATATNGRDSEEKRVYWIALLC